MRLEIKMHGRTLHRTPDIREASPGWGEEGFADIESIGLPLPTGHRIVLAGFEAYNFFVEASQGLSGRGPARIEGFHLCGRLGERVYMVGIFPGRRMVKKDIRPAGQEWGGGPTRGWRPGRRAARQIFDVVEG